MCIFCTCIFLACSLCYETLTNMDVRLQTPFSLLCCGPSECGKMQWTKRLLENAGSMMTNQPDRIVWCYGEYQPSYQELSQQFQSIEFVEGMPSDVCDMFDPGKDPKVISESLSKELESCRQWLIDNKLSLHLGKTESILFWNKNQT